MQPLSKKRRARYSAGERQRLVVAWRKSDQTQVAFAQEHRIRLGTLRRWLYRSEPARTRAAKVDFREVNSLPATWEAMVAPTVEIAVGPEITVRLKGACGPEVIARLVEQLRRPC